jgi:hypothetical protein
MGGGTSGPVNFLTTKPVSSQRSVEEIVSLFFPVYYTDAEPHEEEIMIASKKWNMILDDKSPHFERKKGTPGYMQNSCLFLFYDVFYTRLFDIHPVGRCRFYSP